MNRILRALSFVLLVISGFADFASAHPGHGRTEPQTLWHYVAEPLHGGALWGGLVIVATAAIVGRRRFARRRGNVKSR